MLKTLRHRIRTIFIAGLLVIFPIWVTFVLLRFLIVQLDQVLSPEVARGFEYFGYPGVDIPGLGVIATALAIFLVGLLTTNLVGRRLIILGERVLARLPVVRTIYVAAKQLLEAVAQRKDRAFERVVLVEYPRPGIYAMGFVTSDSRGEVDEVIGEDVVKVFVPTAPNPTSGMLVFVPRREIIALSMSIEEGIKLVVSGGIVTPEYKARLTGERPKELSALSVSASAEVGQGDVKKASSGE